MVTDDVRKQLDDMQLISTEDVAQLLALSPRTLENWRVEGGGPPFVVMSHKCVRYRLSDLKAYLDKRLWFTTTQREEDEHE